VLRKWAYKPTYPLGSRSSRRGGKVCCSLQQATGHRTRRVLVFFFFFFFFLLLVLGKVALQRYSGPTALFSLYGLRPPGQSLHGVRPPKPTLSLLWRAVRLRKRKGCAKEPAEHPCGFVVVYRPCHEYLQGYHLKCFPPGPNRQLGCIVAIATVQTALTHPAPT